MPAHLKRADRYVGCTTKAVKTETVLSKKQIDLFFATVMIDERA